ncbi:MAG: chromosome segregation protein SMC [Thermodesulfobacteriota bacterium]
MRIKSLVIHGFKSFPDRTTLSFESGITAIVGPNGCGKSNIVDGVRWVLGEQSPKTLRGKSMEDVIFKGTANRKSLGMAEVELTLADVEDLTSASGPSEITISRRLYRSGESEYLLNKKPCRLKDITDLFLERGIGSRVYSVIEQAQINQILTGKGQERRLLIEEVAGVSKYRERKRESLLKMHGAQENLARLDDVTAELKRQLNSLKRQANAADKYHHLQEEIKNLDLALTGESFRRLSQEIAQQQLSSLKEGLELTKSQIQSREEEISRLRLNLKEQEQAKGETTEKLTQLAATSEQQRLTILSLSQQKEILVRQAAKVEEEIANTERQLESQRDEWELLSQTQRELEESLGQISSQLEGQESIERSCRQQLEADQRALDEEKDRLFELHRQSTRVEAHVAELKKDSERVRLERNKLTTEIQEAQTKQEEIERERAGLTAELNSLDRAISQENQARESLQKSANQLGQSLAERRARVSELEREVHRLEARLATLKELEAWEEIPSPDSLPEALKPFPRLIDVLEAKAGAELSLGAVLGDRLKYLLVDDLTSAGRLLPSIAGPVGLITASLAREAVSFAERFPEEAALGWLSEFALTREEYRPVLRALLSGWLLVRELEDALRIFANTPEKPNLVTLKGEVLFADGILVSASAGVTKDLLKRKKEAKELTSLLDIKKEALESARRELAQVEGQQDKTDTKLTLNKESLLECQHQRMALKERLNTYQLDAARLKENLKLFAGEERRQEQESAVLASAKQDIVGELAEVRIKIRDKEISSDSLRIGLEERKKELDQVNTLLAHYKVQAASREERLKGVNLNLERLKQSDNQLRGQLAKKEEEKSESRGECERIDAAILSANQIKESVIPEQDRGRAKLENLAAGLEAQTAQLEEMEGQLKEEQRGLAGQQESMNNLELSAARLQMQLDHLAEKISDDYGLELADVVQMEQPQNLPADPSSRLTLLREQLNRLGGVNPLALEEYESLSERYRLLTSQRDDLVESISGLRKAIAEMDKTCRERFQETFNQANERFNQVFRRLFQGGRAQLALAEDEDPLEAAVELLAEPPGKKLQNALLLSSGEKALTAIGFIFSLFMIKPSPFCFLDEIDAPLDDANVGRLNSLIGELAESCQLMLITHNKTTMERASTLHGITMEESGISKLVSVRLN